MKHELHMSATPKWFWMMEYCSKRGLAPAQQVSWDLAEAAYEKEFNLVVSEPTLSSTKALEIIRDRAAARKQKEEQEATAARAAEEAALAARLKTWEPLLDILQAFKQEYPSKITIHGLDKLYLPVSFMLHHPQHARAYEFFALDVGFRIRNNDSTDPFGPGGKAATIAEFIPPLLDLLSRAV